MPIDLSPERGLLFRITHIDNLPWLLTNGLPCANGPQAPRFIAIGNPGLIDRRSTHSVPEPPGGTLADYVPFYFTPRSPMLMNIHTGYRGIQRRSNDEIVMLITAVPTLIAKGIPFLFTDRHAFSGLAQFSADPAKLPAMIDWNILRRYDFARSDDYPDKMARYQAEALVHRHLPAAALGGIACFSAEIQSRVDSMLTATGLALRVVIRPKWYFT
jgi:hypothetical protein